MILQTFMLYYDSVLTLYFVIVLKVIILQILLNIALAIYFVNE